MPSSHNDLRSVAMEPHLFYDQLALWAIIRLFVLLPLHWPRRREPLTPGPATPMKPKRKRVLSHFSSELICSLLSHCDAGYTNRCRAWIISRALLDYIAACDWD